ncbi:helix-turn-helix domain-containing protein [Halorubrum rutilum]|uniref:Helix-turn-helix domain-containing protein n=1 Tax=Halorubrum rutilum TaxID=1364933 RepID=A0ABD6AGN8_9EURY|nr:ATP-binding protein [Halorubrum rutilum]
MANDDLEYQESIKDDLERFFTSPSKDNLPAILSVDKEYDYLDFKSEWHERSQLARHILAFSNSGGGAIIIGVEEAGDKSLESSGVDDPLDESDFGNKVEKYLPDSAHDVYSLETFSYGEVYDDGISGHTFQALFINGAGELVPLVATNAGKNIDEGSIYVRRNTKSSVANYEEVQSLLRRRRESGVEKETAELHEELRQLKTLYNEIDRKKTISSLAALAGALNTFPHEETRPNPHYPNQDYEEYISHLIKQKKIRIEKRLGIENLAL